LFSITFPLRSFILKLLRVFGRRSLGRNVYAQHLADVLYVGVIAVDIKDFALRQGETGASVRLICIGTWLLLGRAGRVKWERLPRGYDISHL
jgi:hypothetical protein